MNFKELVIKKKSESREAFMSMMQERKRLIDSGKTTTQANDAMVQKYKG